MDLSSITLTLADMRVLAHPTRLRMLGLLRTDGPATATGLAARLGLNSGATSYHLRQLAQHGFIEDTPDRGTGRERWWQAAHQAIRTEPSTMTSPEEREVYDAFLHSVASAHTEMLQRAVEERGLLPQEWRNPSTISDWGLRLTPRRAEELKVAIELLVGGYDEELDDEGAEDFVIQVHGFPLPGRVAGTDEGEA